MSRHGESCKNCCHWHNWGANMDGECHRRAPTVVVGVADCERAVWPPTHTHQWCGDWEPKQDYGAKVAEV